MTTVQGTNIKVDWEAPASNYKTISAYMVTIKDKGSGLFAENTALCDGSTTESVANTYCFIPIVSLRLGSSDYDYELGDTPQFQIQAINERGYSPSSDANTLGASIQTEPIQMQSVLRNSATTEN